MIFFFKCYAPAKLYLQKLAREINYLILIILLILNLHARIIQNGVQRGAMSGV